MILTAETKKFATKFGVPHSQIERDYLISHVLKAIAQSELYDRCVFFGGTSLCRTWTADSRLSEDIDLLVDSHTEASETFPKLISRGLRREFPGANWSRPTAKHRVSTLTLSINETCSLQVQLVEWRRNWHKLPVVNAPVSLRYSTLPDTVSLKVPSLVSAAALKLMAWSDRRAPRDLFDLGELAELGGVTAGSIALVEQIIGMPVTSSMIDFRIGKIFEQHWQAELAHQAKHLQSPHIYMNKLSESFKKSVCEI